MLLRPPVYIDRFVGQKVACLQRGYQLGYTAKGKDAIVRKVGNNQVLNTPVAIHPLPQKAVARPEAVVGLLRDVFQNVIGPLAAVQLADHDVRRRFWPVAGQVEFGPQPVPKMARA